MKSEDLYIGEYKKSKNWLKEILALIGAAFFLLIMLQIVLCVIENFLLPQDNKKSIITEHSNFEIKSYPKFYNQKHDKAGNIYYEGITDNGTKMRIYID